MISLDRLDHFGSLCRPLCSLIFSKKSPKTGLPCRENGKVGDKVSPTKLGPRYRDSPTLIHDDMRSQEDDQFLLALGLEFSLKDLAQDGNVGQEWNFANRFGVGL